MKWIEIYKSLYQIQDIKKIAPTRLNKDEKVLEMEIVFAFAISISIPISDKSYRHFVNELMSAGDNIHSITIDAGLKEIWIEYVSDKESWMITLDEEEEAE